MSSVELEVFTGQCTPPALQPWGLWATCSWETSSEPQPETDSVCVCVCVCERESERKRKRKRKWKRQRKRTRKRKRKKGWHPRMTDGFSWKKGGGGMLTRHFRICTCSTFRKKHTCKYRGSGRWIYVCACVRACMCVCRAFFIRTGESCNYHWVLLCTHKAQATQGTLHIHKHTHIVPSHSVQPSWKVPFLPEHQSDHVTMPARLVNRPRLANGYQHPQPHTPHRPTHLLLKVT